jgi:hypothetical protein
MVFGCATNCLPAALPARFALVVAAYSAGDRDFIAASGKYRSPVLDDGFPLLVRHFWSPQSLRDCCGAFTLVLVPAARSLIALSHNLRFSRAPLPSARANDCRSFDAVKNTFAQTRLGVVASFVYLRLYFTALGVLREVSIVAACGFLSLGHLRGIDVPHAA